MEKKREGEHELKMGVKWHLPHLCKDYKHFMSSYNVDTLLIVNGNVWQNYIYLLIMRKHIKFLVQLHTISFVKMWVGI